MITFNNIPPSQRKEVHNPDGTKETFLQIPPHNIRIIYNQDGINSIFFNELAIPCEEENAINNFKKAIDNISLNKKKGNNGIFTIDSLNSHLLDGIETEDIDGTIEVLRMFESTKTIRIRYDKYTGIILSIEINKIEYQLSDGFISELNMAIEREFGNTLK